MNTWPQGTTRQTVLWPTRTSEVLRYVGVRAPWTDPAHLDPDVCDVFAGEWSRDTACRAGSVIHAQLVGYLIVHATARVLRPVASNLFLLGVLQLWRELGGADRIRGAGHTLCTLTPEALEHPDIVSALWRHL